MRWILFAIVASIYFIAPFRRGLFFDHDLYGIEAIILFSLSVWLIYQLVKKERGIPVTYYAIFFIPMWYAIAFFFAESPKNNFDNWLRWMAYSGLFVLLLGIRSHAKMKQWMEFVFQAVGMAIALFAFLGYLGWVDYPDIVLDERLNGSFQYANTFAAVMGAYWLYSMFKLACGNRSKNMVWLFGAPLVLYGVNFILSYSRGAWLVFPIVWFIGMLLLTFRKQVRLIAITVISFLFVLIVFIGATQWELAGGLLFVLLLLCSTVVCLILFFADREEMWPYTFKILRKDRVENSGRIVLPVVIAIIGVLLLLDFNNQGLVSRMLPEGLRDRIGEINLETSSAVGRMEMYRDAFRISAEYPLGKGGDSWRILYNIHQNLPYYSNEIHNGYLEVLLSIGWLGWLVFFTVIGLLFVFLFKGKQTGEGGAKLEYSHFAAFAALLMLFLHAAIDFDFSYGTVWFMIIWLFAMHVYLPEMPVFSPKKKRMPLKPSLSNYVVAIKAVVSITSLVAMVFSFCFLMADQAAAEAQAQGKLTLDQGRAIFEKAVSNNPYDVNFRLGLANIYFHLYNETGQAEWKDRLEEQIHRSEKLEPRNARILFQIGMIYAQLNDWDKSFAYVDKAINYEKFNIDYYQFAIEMKTRLGMTLSSAGSTEEGWRWLNQAVNDYEAYQAWYSEIVKTPVMDRREIHLPRKIEFLAARTYLYLNEPKKAFEVVSRFNPTVEEGIYDTDQNELLVPSFDFISLNELLEQHKENIIILSIRDDAATNLPQSFIENMVEKGSRITDLKYRGSYASVISNGSLVAEYIQNDGEIFISSETNSEISNLFINKKPVTIYSAGFPYGDRSSIVVDGVEYSKNRRGMNIAVFDKEGNNIISIVFDTYNSDISVFKTRS